MYPMRGRWIRPWKGEELVGLVVAQAGELFECQALDGTQFFIPVSFVLSGDVEVLPARPEQAN